MEKIRIGTCVPGAATEQLLPHFVKAGFECVGLNFHMVFSEESLESYYINLIIFHMLFEI